MFGHSASRVPANTAGALNERIARDAAYEVAYYQRHPDQIPERMEQLDGEWDIERTIQAEAPAVTLLGVALGLAVSRKFLVLPLFAQAMLLLHALHGWYPLLPILRRLGFRTPHEIERERTQLVDVSRRSERRACGLPRVA
jgi:hypothetical protein